MPLLIAIAARAIHIARKPLDVRLKRRSAGPMTAIAVGIIILLAWDWLRPAGISASYFVGDAAGVTTVYLMTLALVLATRLTWIEKWFGGLDRMYFWHKQCAQWSMFVLPAHIVLTQTARENVSPRDDAGISRLGLVLGIMSAAALVALVAISLARVGRLLNMPYERWLLIHRFTGLWVILGLIHGLALDPIIRASTPLRVVYLTVGTVGVLAYAYDELIRRRREPRAPYIVTRVERPSPAILDVTLTPTGPDSPSVTGGRFVYLRVGGNRAWREHPFSIAGTYPDGSVRLTIRALGPGTTSLVKDVATGAPATISGPYGLFDHTVGGPRQIWIAGGIGIAPFLGWLTQPEDTLPQADLFYCTPSAERAPFMAELSATAHDHPRLRVHPHFSATDGHLTASKIEALTGPLEPDTHVFLCGPTSLTKAIVRGLRANGVAKDHLHREHFSFR